MANDDSSSSSKQQIQLPLEKEQKLGEESESHAEGEKMTDDCVATGDYTNAESSVDDDDASESAEYDDDAGESAEDDDEAGESAEEDDDVGESAEDDDDAGESAEEEEEEVSTDVEAEKLIQSRSYLDYYDDSDLEDGYLSPDHCKKLVRYWRQIRKSEGKFDIKFEDFPGVSYATPYVPLRFDRIGRQERSKIVDVSKMALDCYNNSNDEKWAFKEVVNVVCSGFIYFITFRAGKNVEANNDDVEVFQAKVCVGIVHIDVYFCRKKPSVYAPPKKRIPCKRRKAIRKENVQ